MAYTQANRSLEITTALGQDALLLTGYEGTESISQLFEFRLDLLAEKEIPFDRIVGEKANIEMRLASGAKRYLDGIVKSFTQGLQDDVFLQYQAQLVPKVWLLTRNLRSRTFQHISVPDILRKVLAGFDVQYDLGGTYHKRDFCVQYRESDFAFISRLMEDEGIYYFFAHTQAGHQMMIRDRLNQHPLISSESASVIWGEKGSGNRENARVWKWEKTQELRSAEYTLWDHTFEVPGNSFEAKEQTINTVAVGKVNHKLALPANHEIEIYEFPGGYAGRFDGVDRNGVPQPPDIQKIFEERTRTARLRMEAEDCAGLLIQGSGDCALFSAGHQFSLERHFFGNGDYLLTRVDHKAEISGYQNEETGEFVYDNRFACIPEALQYRPQRVTPKPVLCGVQTATVVGPPGEEMFTDKYGRVKVQFHWDREGKKDTNSSCWLRVSQVWAGNGWGAFFWPRIGHEVVVSFEDGDPDQPLIIGSVYNSENMPPFTMPQHQQRGGLKSATMRGAPNQNYNAIVFHDEKGNEHVAFHSERHMVFNAEMDKMFRTGRSHGERVPTARTLTVGGIAGGGSGGGGPEDILPQPHPQGIIGINSALVYGVNFQMALPLNFQVALGSNLQICVNPSSLASIFTESAGLPLPGALAQTLGGGTGGNMQCTLGTSANLVIGQSFDINVGPRRIQVDCHPGGADKTSPIQVITIQLTIALQILTLLMAVGYGIPSDLARRLLLVAYQLLMQVLIGQILDFHELYKDGLDGGHSLYDKTFVTDFHDPDPSVKPPPAPVAPTPLPTLTSEYPNLSTVVSASSIMTVLVGELVLELAGGLDTEKADPGS